jgi:hypothetical protein
MSKPGKSTVDLQDAPRVSRIRRDPVTSEKPQGLVSKVYFQSRGWEIGLAIIGIIGFAVALNIIWIALSAWVKL